MNFADKVLLGLTNPATAGAVFSNEALKAVVAASYGVPAASLTGAAVARFDALDFAPFAGDASTEVSGNGYSISRGGARERGVPGLDTRADVLWRGAVTVSAAFERAEISINSSARPDLTDIDGDIPAPVPTDPVALEAARRAVVLERLRANSNSPQAVSDATLDAWLAASGLPDISTFLKRAATSVLPMSQFVLSFTPLPGTGAPAPMAFPVAAALMVRDVRAEGFRLADLMQATRQVQARLEIEGIAPKAGDGLPKGRAAVLWLVAEDWFNDADWPGGDTGNASARRSARITKATEWLAQQAIALVPIAG